MKVWPSTQLPLKRRAATTSAGSGCGRPRDPHRLNASRTALTAKPVDGPVGRTGQLSPVSALGQVRSASLRACARGVGSGWRVWAQLLTASATVWSLVLALLAAGGIEAGALAQALLQPVAVDDQLVGRGHGLHLASVEDQNAGRVAALHQTGRRRRDALPRVLDRLRGRCPPRSGAPPPPRPRRRPTLRGSTRHPGRGRSVMAVRAVNRPPCHAAHRTEPGAGRQPALASAGAPRPWARRRGPAGRSRCLSR